MSRVRADRYTDRAGTGSPTFSEGVNVIGISSLGITTVTGVGQTALTVNGDARITGVLTVGQGSVTIGSTNITTQYINDLQYPTSGPLSNRNLIINGAMRVAQRGTSSTSDDIQTVDRWKCQFGEGAVTQTQESLSTGAPYNEGFRNFVRLQNTTGTTAANGYRNIQQRIEAQDIANCGWDHTSSTSYITLSYWIRSSVAQTYQAYVRTMDGTERVYSFPFTLAADTWTKITETIPGNSSNQINNDNGHGFNVVIIAFYGTNFTDSSNADRTWRDRTSANDYIPEITNTWANTTNATFDLTGVQIEVGERATPFEHRSYGDELARCQRYFQGWNAKSTTERAVSGIFVYDDEGNSSANQTTILGTGCALDSDDARIEFSLPVNMRAKPTTDVGDLRLISGDSLHNSSTTVQYNNSTTSNFSSMVDNGGGMTALDPIHLIIKGNGYFYLDAEL